MPIFINEERNQFHLTNKTVSYLFHVMKNGELGQLYYGKKLNHQPDFSHFAAYHIPTAASCHPEKNDPAFSLETVCQEYPLYGTSDFREPAISLRHPNGSSVSKFEYSSYEVIDGKERIPGMPATFANAGAACTLVITLLDKVRDLKLKLSYTIFENTSSITRHASLENEGEQPIDIERMMSMSLDLCDHDFTMVHLAGTWSRERHVKERKLQTGIQSISSIRGASSHHHNPFMALKRSNATETSGEAYSFHFVYSGNFLAQAEVDHYDTTRIQMGIHPFQFNWRLNPGEAFHTPEVVMTYSDKGLNGLTQSAHNLFREHLIAPVWQKRERPVLINNWEATYFDFNAEKIVAIAKQAKELGVELFVLDDGWFGKRNDDTTSLGDWFVDKNKLPEGIDALSQSVRNEGLKFGLWFEPEMISEESDLYSKHPDWVIHDPERPVSYGRNQWVLDYTREEVVDYLFERISSIIQSAKLSYIKWDMNRNITEAYSAALGQDRQGEFFHRYILGVYSLYERLTFKFPDVLFESCAGGGGRFDAGMLFYAPQAWASDDTDAVERLKIQYGSSFIYPIYSIGSHVSDIPNHQTLRRTSLKARGDAAYFGTFGYELDPNKMTDEEKAEVKSQIETYKSHRTLIRNGDFYRLISPFESNETAWMIVSKDQTEAFIGWYQVLATPNPKKIQTLKLAGLDANSTYHVNGSDQAYGGDELMQRGLQLPVEYNGVNKNHAERGGDFQSSVFHLTKNGG
ncbi:alpha-galactosidase [Metabacillus hrfriensis]|uniref:Alpha-galactosidase n=1 Tax=Metabacillus hrfriensis TaxID=3048891 RepID=A0ACD4RCD1_9BACI|nr:alpha-galactosidase [Metabacillus sp. CT-WN-B3]USK28936.1 alpha-galactosidase [Bacillus sp. CMF21]WHZ58155.1 alpha-galactosidase [Metabacillus sp. CT-WN-B3]